MKTLAILTVAAVSLALSLPASAESAAIRSSHEAGQIESLKANDRNTSAQYSDDHEVEMDVYVGK